MANISSRPSQSQMFYAAGDRLARMNDTFLVLVRSGMTRGDLEMCIQKRPELWSRFANWLPKLPEQRPEKLRSSTKAKC